MNNMIDEMPTKLIRRDPERPLMVVTRSTYLELMARYNKVMAEGESMMELIDVMDGTIKLYEKELDEMDEILSDTTPESSHTFYTDDDYESGKLKVNFTPEKGVEIVKPKKRKKFAGATLEFDPFKRTFGLGLHFKEVSE